MTVALPRPWLAAEPGEMRGATLLEWAALLGGHARTDHPAGVHPVLVAAVRRVGARLADEPRQDLLGLLGGLVDTTPTGNDHDQKMLDVRLACWCAVYVLPQTRPQDRDACQAAIDTALAWADGTATEGQCQQAAAAAYTAVRDASWAAAWAASAAYAVSIASDFAAAAASFAADAAAAAESDLPAFLAGLIDEYDRLTGRTRRQAVTDEDLASLAVLAGLGA